MWILKLAWKNIWRNRGRTMITTAAVFFAVILSTLAESLKQGIFDNLVKNVVSFYTGYIQVHKLGYQDEQVLENSFPFLPAVITSRPILISGFTGSPFSWKRRGSGRCRIRHFSG